MSRNTGTGSLWILYYFVLGVSFTSSGRKKVFIVENYFTDDPYITDFVLLSTFCWKKKELILFWLGLYFF